MCPLFILSMKVSIIIPAYNQEHLILRALDSIPQRDDIEIIVVDDASTDRTVPNVTAWAKNHPNMKLRLFRNEVNRGVGYARNIALDNATGDYIYGLDSDDYLYTDKFEDAMNQLDGTGLVYVAGVSDDGFKWIPDAWNAYEWGAFWLKFVRRNLIGNLRCPAIRWAEDKDFTAKILAKDPTIKRTGIFCYHYTHPRAGSLCHIENYGNA